MSPQPVMLRDDATTADMAACVNQIVSATSATQEFQYASKGFIAKAVTRARIDALRQDSRVRYVEQDCAVRMNVVQTPVPSWGVDRIDTKLPRVLDNQYTYSQTGKGVSVTVLDTGLNFDHSDFAGRATCAHDVFGGACVDQNGHGTHVAGTIAGTLYGVAKNATLRIAKVLDESGSGSVSGIVATVNAEVAALQGVKRKIMSLSLGGGVSQAMDDVLGAAANAGFVVVVAAGNSNANACNYSPARLPAAITVGATTITDERASFSNYGMCLDIFAPGFNIRSAWIGNQTATKVISGTSMATPHTAGVLAIHLEQWNPLLEPNATLFVRQLLVSQATVGAVVNAGTGSPNLLLYSPPGGDTTTTTTTQTTRPSSTTGTSVPLVPIELFSVHVSAGNVTTIYNNPAFPLCAHMKSAETSTNVMIGNIFCRSGNVTSVEPLSRFTSAFTVGAYVQLCPGNPEPGFTCSRLVEVTGDATQPTVTTTTPVSSRTFSSLPTTAPTSPPLLPSLRLIASGSNTTALTAGATVAVANLAQTPLFVKIVLTCMVTSCRQLSPPVSPSGFTRGMSVQPPTIMDYGGYSFGVSAVVNGTQLSISVLREGIRIPMAISPRALPPISLQEWKLTFYAIGVDAVGLSSAEGLGPLSNSEPTTDPRSPSAAAKLQIPFVLLLLCALIIFK